MPSLASYKHSLSISASCSSSLPLCLFFFFPLDRETMALSDHQGRPVMLDGG